MEVFAFALFFNTLSPYLSPTFLPSKKNLTAGSPNSLENNLFPFRRGQVLGLERGAVLMH